MMRSLFSGVAGLKTHQTKMDVIGNNISNVNTVAFKSSGVNFADIMYQTTSRASGATATTGGVNAKQIGLGVSTASTKVKITNGGSAQSTGDALDIRLSDANSTNFFIVNNGSQNLFTRDGSFYIDGNGNLAMTSTGYLVEGWQVNKETMTIQKDTVSALRVMDPTNLTSSPEATTDATATGLIDKNDSNVSSSNGYVMSLGFYDNLGYAYTAKFSVKGYDMDDTKNYTVDPTTLSDPNATDSMNTYTVQLTGIYDADNNDILATYINGFNGKVSVGSNATPEAIDIPDLTNKVATATDATAKATAQAALDVAKEKVLSSIFGVYNSGTTGADDATVYQGGSVATNIDIASGVTYNAGVFTMKNAGGDTIVSKTVPATIKDNNAITFVNQTTGADEDIPLTSIFAISEVPSGELSIDGATLRVVNKQTSYFLNFKHGDGTFANIAGKIAQNINTSRLGTQFQDIAVDFSSVLNYDNGGTSTMGLDRGSVENASVGAGKKLGAMTGLSIQQDGKIYGSYDNGNTVLLGQIAVAQFANASGLESLGNNCYNTTLNSGDFDGIGVEVTADGGKMNTGQLEMSNVDLSNEFTDMITTQRGFQANSRIITVSDTMLEELTNLKR